MSPLLLTIPALSSVSEIGLFAHCAIGEHQPGGISTPQYINGILISGPDKHQCRLCGAELPTSGITFTGTTGTAT